MDIRQLRYFIAIVENNFNLSRAAESLYIVQPTLSMMIKDFEENENVTLFVRRKGLIKGLTPDGKRFHKDALEVVNKYNHMKRNLHHAPANFEGEVSIGIPPIFFDSFFSEIMPDLIINHPTIDFKIIEEGATSLSNKLLLEDIDIAALLAPEGISHDIIESNVLKSSELVVFMSPEHELASKDQISWKDIHKAKIASLNKTFMTYRLFKQKCEQLNVYPNVVFFSQSWPLLIALVKRDPTMLTVLPHPVLDIIDNSDVVVRKIDEPIPWIATLCRLKNKDVNGLEDFVLGELLKARDK